MDTSSFSFDGISYQILMMYFGVMCLNLGTPVRSVELGCSFIVISVI